MSDLAGLFPDLPREIIKDFETTGSQGALSTTGEEAAVTDEEVEAYLRSIGSLRAPLRPVLDNAQVPDAPIFANNGRPAPAINQATVEDPDPASAPDPRTNADPDPSPLGPSPTPTLPTPDPEPEIDPAVLPPPPPGGGEPSPTPEPSPQVDPTQPGPPAAPVSEYVTVNGLMVTRERAENAAALSRNLVGNPNAPRILQTFLETGTLDLTPSPVQAPPVAPPAPAPAPLPQGAVPRISRDEYDLLDPTTQRIYDANVALEQRVNQLAQTQRVQDQVTFDNQVRAQTQIVNGVISEFKSRYQLDDQTMTRLRQAAGRLGVAATYMNGTHPITGQPVIPNPADATRTALEVAFWSLPETRAIDAEREVKRRELRAQATATRKGKLAGISGASGSVPRSQPAPSDDTSRRTAMIGEMTEMLNGSWTGN